MILLILQILLLLPAGAGVYLMWRRVASFSPIVAWLVTAGLLVRSVAGQAAFWISFLKLPIARSLQLGDGFWIFGLDAQTFFHEAAAAAHSGPLRILLLDRTMSSVFYIQVLATVVLLFGAVASTGLLLNVVAYLGCCLILLSFGDPMRSRSVVFSIAVLSLAPSPVIWTLQPMKDMWFLLLMGSFFYAAHAWQGAWDGKKPSRSAVWSTLLMVSTVYAMSGIRWYVGFIAGVACLPFALFSVWRAPRRFRAACTAAVMVPILFAAVIAGAKPYVAPIMNKVVHGSGGWLFALPRALADGLHDARAGFDRSGGTTLIGVGRTVGAIDAQNGVKVAAGPSQVSQPLLSGSRSQAPLTTSAESSANAAPVSRTSSSVDRPVERPKGFVELPTSHIGRLAAGIAVMTLPRMLAQRLGLVDVRVGRGGRGLWVFVEMDTIAFDVAGVVCFVSIMGALRRRALGAPLFWLLLTFTILLGAGLAYTISNFGTLFRQRDMILLCLAMLPLTTLPPSRENAFVQEKDHSTARDVGAVIPSV